MKYDLQRFLNAQNQTYLRALEEVKEGQKVTHWMWFIFPQLKGLGHSETAQFYAIQNLSEAQLFMQHPVLGANLLEICQALLLVRDKTANDIFGYPDELKLQSSMTLFLRAADQNTVFKSVLDKYFEGALDIETLIRLEAKPTA